MTATRRSSRSSCSGSTTTATSTRTSTPGLYCVGCEAFKSEDELVDGKCPDHGIEPEWIEEKNWFFRLSAYQDRLLELYEQRPDFVLPAFRANEAKGFIAGGLRDFSISRAGQTWGIPIPWDPEQVAYVWADALVNYRSALEYARPGEDLTHLWSGVRHLLAKDILRFHCVYWPALLLSAGYDVPRQLFVHGYLNLGGRAISKTLGNVIDPLELIDEYGVDPVRFWIARAVQFGQDGNVSLDTFRERYERELGNDLGNLLSRTTAMIARYRDGELKIVAGERRRARRGRRAGSEGRARRTRRLRHHGRSRDDLGARAPPEPARRADAALAAGQGRRARGRARPGALRARGRASVCRGRALRLRPRDGGADPRRPRSAARRRVGERGLRPHGRGDRDRGGAAALPPDRRPRDSVIDTHAHLDGCDEPAGELLARAREAGVTRVIAIGTGIESSRAALALAAEHDGVRAVLGIDPHQAGGEEADRIDELRELLGQPGSSPWARPASTTTTIVQRPKSSCGSSTRRSSSHGSCGLPLVIHSRDADEQTTAALARFDGRVILHCFSSAGLLPAALERGYYVSFAGNVTYPKATELREAAARVPTERILAETDSPYLAPQPLRGRPNEPAHVVHTVAALAAARGEDADELAAQIDANASAVFRL